MKTTLKRTAAALFVFVLIFLFACSNGIQSDDPLKNPIVSPDESIIEETSFEEFSEEETSVPESLDVSEESYYSDETSEEPAEERVRFLACPDNIIHPSVFYDAIERAARENGIEPEYSDLHNADYNFYPIYQNVKDAIEQADIAYLNQETLIGGTGGKIIGYPCFNSPHAVAETVIDLGFDVINVAHNHMLDSRDTEYLENCNKVFEEAGKEVIGYYPNEDSINNITVIENNGIRIAFLAYTYGTNGLDIPKDSEFVIPYFSDDLVTKQVSLAKEASDFIIVSCHWGYENTYNENKEQRYYASLMNELGVDIVLGMHPHVIQPMEWMTHENGNKTLVVYSLGNFVSGMVSGRNMLAGMLSLEIVKDLQSGNIYIETPKFIPTVTHYVKKDRVASNDTGYRDFEIYYLSDYTEEIAATHGVCKYERSHGTTLVGGKFSKENLLKTLYEYIPIEFLPEEYS